MHRNSLTAYEEIETKGIRSERYRQIIGLLYAHTRGLTSKEISKMLQMPINCISGRLTELRDKFRLVVEAGTKRNEYNRPCAIWRLSSGKQGVLF